METQNRDMKPIRVTLTTTQIVDLVAPQALDPIREADDPQARAVVRRTVEALDRLGLIVREAK